MMNCCIVQPMKNVTTSKLDPKQRRFVAARAQGKSKRESGLIAGASTEVAADKYAERMSKNVLVQEAIDNALKFHGATPEYAVGILKEVADQDEEIGAKRLAAKDILELHGWRKDQRPTVSLTFKSSFFNASRNKGQDNVVEGEVVQD